MRISHCNTTATLIISHHKVFQPHHRIHRHLIQHLLTLHLVDLVGVLLSDITHIIQVLVQGDEDLRIRLKTGLKTVLKIGHRIKGSL